MEIIASRMSIADKAAKAFLVMLSPAVLGWTVHSFWRLATKGTLFVRDHGHIIEVSGGLNFWVTVWLYLVLLVASIIVLLVFVSSLRPSR